MGKPLNFPFSFRPICLTFCVPKLFERIIVSLFFFLESNSVLSPRQADFRSGRSTLDQILFQRVDYTVKEGRFQGGQGGHARRVSLEQVEGGMSG